MKKSTNINLIVILSILLSLFYAIVRYHIFHDVPWTDLPLYVLNKSISLASVILFAIYQILKQREENRQIKLYKDYSVILAITHVVISVIILSPNYYPKFYNGLQLNLVGNLTLLFGIFAFIIMFLFSNKYFFRKSINDNNTMMIIRNIFIICIMLHLLFMGFKGWLEPSAWPGGLPPITLLSFLILLTPIFFKLKFVK